MLLPCLRISARLATGLLLSASLVSAVSAQTTGPSGRAVYEAQYFQPFAPSTALEIVRRVPGFTLELGSEDVRGFGQAAGNVVINGARSSSKTDTLETILARIPASRVARVEVGTGDLFGAEFSGKPQVLNLVLTATGGLAGTANVSARRIFTGAVDPQGSISMLLRRGSSSFNVSLGVDNTHTFEEGYDLLLRLPSKERFEYREKTNDIRDRTGFLSGSWENQGGENRSARLNFG